MIRSEVIATTFWLVAGHQQKFLILDTGSRDIILP
jgi:hypothetical protein